MDNHPDSLQLFLRFQGRSLHLLRTQKDRPRVFPKAGSVSVKPVLIITLIRRQYTMQAA